MVDVSKRRLPLQKKVGMGLTTESFLQLAHNNQIGHVRLEESLRLLAFGLGVELTDVQNTIQPTVADSNSRTEYFQIKTGEVSGLHQTADGKTKDRQEIVLDLVMSLGVQQQDEIQLEGDENLQMVIPGGVFGDSATAVMMINTAKLINSSKQYGLLTWLI